jgi:hypothetical protein
MHMLFVSTKERRNLCAMASHKNSQKGPYPLCVSADKRQKRMGDGRRGESVAGISKDYCGTKSGSPAVELRFCPWLIIVQILNWVA